MISFVYYFMVSPEGRSAPVSKRFADSWVTKVGKRATALARDIDNHREHIALRKPDVHQELAKQR